MDLRPILYPARPDGRSSLALLIARASAGLLVAPHGFYKLINGPGMLAGGLAQGGFPAPTLLAWCATLSELVGGLLMALGLLTRPAAATVTFTMVVAWATQHLKNLSDIGRQGGPLFEYPFLLSMIALAITIAGPGRYSVDDRIYGRR